MARKGPTVLDWLSTIDNGSDQIETVICFGAREICKGPSP